MRLGESPEEPRAEERKDRAQREPGRQGQRTPRQRGATTAVTTLDWRPRLGRGSRPQAEGAEKPWSPRNTTQKARYENLMEAVVNRENATRAWKAVKRNQGAPGIDRMTTDQLPDHIRRHWEEIRAKLLGGAYVPSPVRRKEISKPDGGVRLLGIPTVQDRWIQQMLLQVLQPIFDPTFHGHSYGFRPGRSAHEAVKAAQTYAQAGKNWVVDMDITKFFDRVNHDLLMHRVGQRIRDKRMLRLIGRYLRAGVMIQGVVQESEEGTPQGGPLSPLLANIYRDALDPELERRGLKFSR